VDHWTYPNLHQGREQTHRLVLLMWIVMIITTVLLILVLIPVIPLHPNVNMLIILKMDYGLILPGLPVQALVVVELAPKPVPLTVQPHAEGLVAQKVQPAKVVPIILPVVMYVLQAKQDAKVPKCKLAKVTARDGELQQIVLMAKLVQGTAVLQ